MRLDRRREKVFGPGRAVPLDRNAKARIAAYARAWSASHRQDGQHKGPITRAFLDVLHALLWGFHNSRTGCCFPSYERIAEKAECSRTTVYEALNEVWVREAELSSALAPKAERKPHQTVVPVLLRLPFVGN
jgi:hypothetical protein